MPKHEQTLLLVEDNADNALLIRELAEEMGLRLLVATNGQHGLDLARAERPGVILLDLALPLVDGWEAARRLKADPRTAAIPIVAITARAMDGDEQRAISAGCDVYLSKPVDIDALEHLINDYLKGAGRGELA